ncbi:unnamed protein product [Brassica rapa]|uniref:Reverse transcriptase zinc-binding domain-containing protein n=1 Tax=Brassica campestris TaxID=3711 RepID=A0A3P6C5M1_BRACM|nr:unnamed protein product [Brassica rapa]VDD06025.1 unnamed protein product [Brassica rapa]
MEGESINHVLLTCPAACLVWAQSNFPFPRRGSKNMTLFENFNYLLFLPRYLKVPDEIGRMFPWILWTIWKNKNLFLFEGKEFAVEDTMAKVIEDSSHWFEAQKCRDEEDEAGNRELRARDKWEGQAQAF